MRHKRMLGSALVAVIAACVLTAIAAQANEGPEGPFFNFEAKRLGAGESKEMTGGLGEGSHLQLQSGKDTIKCTTLKFAEGAKLIGSSVGNPGKGEQMIESEGCTVEGAGTGCKVEKNKIKTLPMKIELGYETNARSGAILVYAQPTTGKILATVQLEGPCETTKLEYEGTAIGEAFRGGKAVEVGKEPPEGMAGEAAFPTTAIAKGWFESNSVLSEKTAKLTAAGSPAILEVRITLDLKVGVWGWKT